MCNWHGTAGLMREWRQVSDWGCEMQWNVGVAEVETQSVGRQTVTVPPSQGTDPRRPTRLARNTEQGGWRRSGGRGPGAEQKTSRGRPGRWDEAAEVPGG